MGTQLLAIVLAVFAVASGQPADRAWETGKWGAAAVTVSTTARGRSTVRVYVIDADDARYEAQEPAVSGVPPLATTAGAPVAFAVENDAVYVREGANTERQLHLLKTTRKLKTYGAGGPGHFIRAIGETGRTITLEDGSVWDVDPRTQFKAAQWEALAGITVHRTEEDPDFNYILNNTDVDDWTFVILARGPA
jgi:hypothetical protein